MAAPIIEKVKVRHRNSHVHAGHQSEPDAMETARRSILLLVELTAVEEQLLPDQLYDEAIRLLSQKYDIEQKLAEPIARDITDIVRNP